MPCDSVRLMPVKLEACDAAIMFAALQKLKLRPDRDSESPHIISFAGRESIDCQTGEGTFRPSRNVNEIKRAYSTVALQQTADEYGWAVETTGENQFELTARF